MRILTGIDMPLTEFGGSATICNDWYSNLPPEVEVRFLGLAPPEATRPPWWTMDDVVFLDVQKVYTHEDYPRYVELLGAAIVEQVERFQPDLIHCQHLNFGFSAAVARFAPADIPQLGICHGTDVQIAQSDQSGFFREIMVAISQAMDHLLFPTEQMVRDFARLAGPIGPYTVSPHGIPDEAYMRVRPWPHSSTLRLLYAGRLNTWKGADVVVAALRSSDAPVELTLVGREDEVGYRQRLLDAVERWGLQGRVRFLEQIPRHHLWELFNSYDVLVCPSRELECFSLVAVEAQARGLVVMYHKGGGGISDVLGASGIAVAPNTPEHWAEAICALCARPELLSIYRKRGYANAEQYRLSIQRGRFFDLSRRLIATPTRGTG